MSAVNTPQPQSVFSLLGGAMDIGRQLMLTETAADQRGLRGSHLRVLTRIPREGMRPTALAGRVGMTKQSLGEFVAALETAGYVRVSVDPADRRARIVTPTPSGEKLQDQIARVFADIEARWQQEVGSRQWSAFLNVLRHLNVEHKARKGPLY